MALVISLKTLVIWFEGLHVHVGLHVFAFIMVMCKRHAFNMMVLSLYKAPHAR